MGEAACIRPRPGLRPLRGHRGRPGSGPSRPRARGGRGPAARQFGGGRTRPRLARALGRAWQRGDAAQACIGAAGAARGLGAARGHPPGDAEARCLGDGLAAPPDVASSPLLLLPARLLARELAAAALLLLRGRAGRPPLLLVSVRALQARRGALRRPALLPERPLVGHEHLAHRLAAASAELALPPAPVAPLAHSARWKSAAGPRLAARRAVNLTSCLAVAQSSRGARRAARRHFRPGEDAGLCRWEAAGMAQTLLVARARGGAACSGPRAVRVGWGLVRCAFRSHAPLACAALVRPQQRRGRAFWTPACACELVGWGETSGRTPVPRPPPRAPQEQGGRSSGSHAQCPPRRRRQEERPEAPEADGGAPPSPPISLREAGARPWPRASPRR